MVAPNLPTFNDDEASALLHNLQPLQTFFVQVGAMDGIRFDPMHPFIKHYQWPGLLIEPMPAAFAELQKNYAGHAGALFANCAIADHNGTITMRYLDPTFVADGRLPPEVLGMSTTSTNPTHFLPSHVRPEFKDHLQAAERTLIVPCATLQTVLDQHHVTKIDLFICDTEGADGMVLNQLDLQRYRPSLVFFEYDIMPAAELTALINKFQAAGYTAKVEAPPGQNMIFFLPPAGTKRLVM